MNRLFLLLSIANKTTFEWKIEHVPKIECLAFHASVILGWGPNVRMGFSIISKTGFLLHFGGEGLEQRKYRQIDSCLYDFDVFSAANDRVIFARTYSYGMIPFIL